MAPWRVNIATVTTVSVNMGMDYRGMEGAVGAVRDDRFFCEDEPKIKTFVYDPRVTAYSSDQISVNKITKLKLSNDNISNQYICNVYFLLFSCNSP